MSQFTYFAARFLMKQRMGFKKNQGIATVWAAILSITLDRLRKGESNIRALTSQEYIQANIIAHKAPMLRPQSVTLLTLINFLTYCRVSLISKTQLIPQVRRSGSLLPQPRKSNATTLILNLGIKGTKGKAYILLPPFPCKQIIVCSGYIYGEQKRNAEIFLLFLFVIYRSCLIILNPFIVLVDGPNKYFLVFICVGITMFFHEFSYKFIKGNKQLLNYIIIIIISKL